MRNAERESEDTGYTLIDVKMVHELRKVTTCLFMLTGKVLGYYLTNTVTYIYIYISTLHVYLAEDIDTAFHNVHCVLIHQPSIQMVLVATKQRKHRVGTHSS